MVEGYDFDEDDKMDEIESDYQANRVSDNLRTCGRVHSVSNDIHIINELRSPYILIVFGQMTNLNFDPFLNGFYKKSNYTLQIEANFSILTRFWMVFVRNPTRQRAIEATF